MYLWGVVVLELERNPDYNKGPDDATCALVHRPIPKIIDHSHTT